MSRARCCREAPDACLRHIEAALTYADTPGAAAPNPEWTMTDSVTDIPFFRQPSATLMSGGQPSPGQLAAAAAAGVRHIINLRPASEDPGYDEEAEAEALGLRHTRIPVAGGAGLTRANAEALDAALASSEGQPTLVHCASSNRVGALFALRAAWLQGKPVEEALAEGRSTGLTGMEATVRQMLGG